MNTTGSPATSRPGRHSPIGQFALTIAACIGTTLLATPLLGHLDLANIVMLFLLTVLLIAVTLGRNAAVLASILSVLLFDIFFVEPRFSLAVDNIQYLVTFAVMLATALITGQLAAGLKQRAQEARIREQRTQALYELARQLAGALTLEQVRELAGHFVEIQLAAHAAAILPADQPENDVATAPAGAIVRVEPHLVRVALDSGQLVRSDTVGELGLASLYLPLRASLQTRGVLAVDFGHDRGYLEAETQSLLEALASLVAVAVERLHYADVAQRTELTIQSERLRSSILSALSHDLRTPLTALVGLADSLSLVKPPLPATALDTALAMHEQAARLAGLVDNLLDMAQLNAGGVTLRREWQPIEEVIGASIKLLGSALASHPVRVSLPPDLPLIEFDAVLLERVFCNLLENAAKYAPQGTPIEIVASQSSDLVTVRVSDHGPGFPTAKRDELFNMFVRGATESGKLGTGLGLAICRTIIEAHGGRIDADKMPDGGGASVSFTLPKGLPPVVEEEKS